uniref:Uncharacterized protein n=1 Tax=Opuntia streptacantha TaxID=393608 RepID=A0A7C9DTY5_OPUST
MGSISSHPTIATNFTTTSFTAALEIYSHQTNRWSGKLAKSKLTPETCQSTTCANRNCETRDRALTRSKQKSSHGSVFRSNEKVTTSSDGLLNETFVDELPETDTKIIKFIFPAARGSSVRCSLISWISSSKYPQKPFYPLVILILL